MVLQYDGHRFNVFWRFFDVKSVLQKMWAINKLQNFISQVLITSCDIYSLIKNINQNDFSNRKTKNDFLIVLKNRLVHTFGRDKNLIL